MFAIATVLGPIVGGVIVDTSWLGWRWCFYVGVPFAVIALIVLQKTLKLPEIKREAKIDYLGATLIVGGVSVLLVWVSLAGTNFGWASVQTLLMVVGGVLMLGLAVLVELHASEPIIPMALFKNSTVTLASVAAVFVGSALFGVTVFLSQYFQIARAMSPTMSGLATVPMVVGMFLASLIIGRIITKTGLWKRYLVGGSLALVAGLVVLGTMRADTPYLILAAGMLLAGVGMGATMQNLVLAVQNSVSMRDIGSASATITFIRSLGGAIGVSALGAVLASQVTQHVSTGLRALSIDPTAVGPAGAVPNPALLPAPIAYVVENAYGLATSSAFIISAIAAALGAIAIFFIREVPLRMTTADENDLHESPQPIVSKAPTAEDLTAEDLTAEGLTGEDLAETPVFAGRSS